MEIKTNFFVGDVIFCIHEKKIRKGIIRETDVNAKVNQDFIDWRSSGSPEIENTPKRYEKEINVKHWVLGANDENFFANDNHCYASREELIENL